jgi:hypothetical protein
MMFGEMELTVQTMMHFAPLDTKTLDVARISGAQAKKG